MKAASFERRKAIAAAISSGEPHRAISPSLPAGRMQNHARSRLAQALFDPTAQRDRRQGSRSAQRLPCGDRADVGLNTFDPLIPIGASQRQWTVCQSSEMSCAPQNTSARGDSMKEQEAPLTLRDIARQAGVSLATVDRVLHNRPGVRPDTVRRVKEAVERNAFQPHVAAADLARGRTRRFIFVMPSGSNLFMQEIEAYLGEMSAWLSARRLAVEKVATDVFDAAVLASTLESLVGDFDGV